MNGKCLQGERSKVKVRETIMNGEYVQDERSRIEGYLSIANNCDVRIWDREMLMKSLLIQGLRSLSYGQLGLVTVPIIQG